MVASHEASPIEKYIAEQSEAARPHLEAVYELIKKMLPDAEEKIAWNMPTFYQGKNIIHFAAFKNHLGLYPSQNLPEEWKPWLEGYGTGKGSVQFPYADPLPVELITKLVQWCKDNRVPKA